jgi:hypothetical protein
MQSQPTLENPNFLEPEEMLGSAAINSAVRSVVPIVGGRAHFFA